MAKELTVRGRAAPKALLHARTFEDMARFANRLGRVTYGSDWRPDVLSELSRPDASPVDAGTNADLAFLVRDQIMEGLRSGLLRAVALVIASSRPDSRRSGDLEDDDPILQDDGTPRLRVFTIKRELWQAHSPEIDWSASTATLSSEHLYDASISQSASYPIGQLFDVPNLVQDAPFKVCDPEQALRRAIRYEELPDEAWFKRYQKYRKDGRLEALAAAWRYIAVATAREEKLPSAAELARCMEDYLTLQGIQPPRSPERDGLRDSSLQELAARVLTQFKAQSLSSSVLVSSNPRHP